MIIEIDHVEAAKELLAHSEYHLLGTAETYTVLSESGRYTEWFGRLTMQMADIDRVEHIAFMIQRLHENFLARGFKHPVAVMFQQFSDPAVYYWFALIDTSA